MSSSRANHACLKMKDLPPNSPLLKLSLSEIFPAFLPPEVALHGVTTNNFAEITAKMLLPARKCQSLMDSLVMTVSILHHRRLHILEQMCKIKRGISGEGTEGRPFEKRTVLPHVNYEHEVVVQLSMKMRPAVPSAAGKGVFVCEDTKGRKMIVNTSLLKDGPYAEACSCGRVAKRLLWCKHVENVLSRVTIHWTEFMKPWLRASAWEKQLGPVWNIPSPFEVMQNLKLDGQKESEQVLLSLKQPTIVLRAAGALCCLS